MNAIVLPTHNPMIRVLSACAAGLIVVQLLILQEPDYAVHLVDATWDKLIHFAVFGACAFFIWLATGGRWPLIVWAVVVLVGALDETQQIYTPGRTASIADLAADGAGATAALFVLSAMNQPKKED
jgi:VanZ family protein